MNIFLKTRRVIKRSFRFNHYFNMWHKDHPIIRQSDIELLEISLQVTEHNESIKIMLSQHTKHVTENLVSHSSFFLASSRHRFDDIFCDKWNRLWKESWDESRGILRNTCWSECRRERWFQDIVACFLVRSLLEIFNVIVLMAVAFLNLCNDIDVTSS